MIASVEAEAPAPEILRHPADPNLELSFEEDDEFPEAFPVDPIGEFDDNETLFENQFGRSLRLSCCAHVAQRVLCETVEKAPDWKILL